MTRLILGPVLMLVGLLLVLYMISGQYSQRYIAQISLNFQTVTDALTGRCAISATYPALPKPTELEQIKECYARGDFSFEALERLIEGAVSRE